MKITKIFLVLFLISFKHAQGLAPAGTFTIANPCLPSASITPIANAYGCFSYSAFIVGTPSPNDYYTWHFGDGDTAVGNHVYHCYPSSSVITIYTVTVKYNTSTPCGGITSQSYTISLNPAPQVICQGGPIPVDQSALSVTVNPGFQPGIYVVSYNFGDSAGFTYNNVHHYAVCGDYIIQTSEVTLTNPEDSCIAFTAVNLSCNSSTTITDGIPVYTLKNQPALLFPNPVSETLNIHSGKTIQSISIVDLIGRACLRENGINDTQARLNVQDFYPGTYFINLVYGDDSKEHLKFIKK